MRKQQQNSLQKNDSTLANTDDILPTDTDSEEDNEENRNPKRMFSKRMKTVWRMEIYPQRKFKAQHLQIRRMYGLLKESTLAWPASGATLLSFSMDHTVYFPTLEQYKYNPALIIGGTQGEVIHAAAAGVVEILNRLPRQELL